MVDCKREYLRSVEKYGIAQLLKSYKILNKIISALLSK